MNEEFKLLITNFLNEKSKNKISSEEIEWAGNFIEKGYLDSLDVYNLLLYLEENLSVELELSDLIADFPSSFASLYQAIYP
jgi:acyl carrier protein